jgi:hypothetical protein
VFKVGDKVRLVDNTSYEKFPVGTVDTVARKLPDEPHNGDLLLFEGPLEKSHGMYSYRFELVPESPYDLVIQDRVPAREGIDFGWWVDHKEFDTFKPSITKTWRMVPKRAGLMHGAFHEIVEDRLFVTCYRKDLPVLPISERVVLDEYLVWDIGGPKCLLWSDTNPTIENESYGAWDHAFPTGNTREVEVPVVKP